MVVGTSMKHAAGTDANVYIKIYGTDGNSGEIKLDNAEDNFERQKLVFLLKQCAWQIKSTLEGFGILQGFFSKGILLLWDSSLGI